MIIPNQKVKVTWTANNREYYESKGYIFTKYNDKFEVDVEDLSPSAKVKVRAKCSWCDREFIREYYLLARNKSNNHYCSLDCQHKHRSKIAYDNKPTKKCEECGKLYKVSKHNYDVSRFCSSKCLANWQSKAFKGKNSPVYVERIIVKCDWCGKDLERTPYQLRTRKYNFCDRDCQNNWFKNVYIKQEDVIERNKQIMLNNLVEGKISFTNSKPQIIINNLLDDLNIKYINEYAVGDFSFDVYLPDYDLFIEVNGGFWHCDNRLYEKIEYIYQLNRIIGDKRKKTFVKNKLKKHILYLWELDIETDIELCKKLILEFIKNNGKLKDYHSFNYFINGNGELSLEKQKIKPYMDLSFDKIAEITELSIRKERTGYQPEKHITFNCDYCGKEKTILLKQYLRSKNHFCSVKCKNLSQQKDNNKNELGHIHKCPSCNKDFWVRNYRYLDYLNGKTKNLFCSRECKANWESQNKRGENNPAYKGGKIKKTCLFCKKEYFIKPHRKNISKYCSKECQFNDRKNQILTNCGYCGKEMTTTPSKLKYSKSGKVFCSNKCVGKYNSMTKKKRISKTCLICGSNYEVIPSQAEKSVTCSVECQHIWQSKYLVGKKANNYKHGKYVKS